MKPHHIARLNTPTANYQGSNGGQPHITRDDIAGELAKFQDKPIELYALCLIWWPGGVAHVREAAERALVTRAIHRWEEHNKTVSHCEAMKQIARLENNTSQAIHWENQQAQAIARRFPKPAETDYRAVIHAAATEFAHPPHCKPCHGSGSIKNSKGHLVPCERCHGNGKLAMTNHARAKACGKHAQAFKESWRGVYEWALGEISREYQKAINFFVGQPSEIQQQNN